MAKDKHHQTQTIRKFKGATVFEWESEPADERPSEFAATTQYGALAPITTRSGFVPLEVSRARPAQKRGGGGSLWWACSILLIVATGGMFAFTHLLRA